MLVVLLARCERNVAGCSGGGSSGGGFLGDGVHSSSSTVQLRPVQTAARAKHRHTTPSAAFKRRAHSPHSALQRPLCSSLPAPGVANCARRQFQFGRHQPATQHSLQSTHIIISSSIQRLTAVQFEPPPTPVSLDHNMTDKHNTS